MNKCIECISKGVNGIKAAVFGVSDPECFFVVGFSFVSFIHVNISANSIVIFCLHSFSFVFIRGI